MDEKKGRIEKIGDDYFINSILQEVIVEKELEKPLPLKMVENCCLMKEPLCCLCGIWGERRDIIILCVEGDWSKWICGTCVEKYMPDLYGELMKKCKEAYLERTDLTDEERADIERDYGEGMRASSV